MRRWNRQSGDSASGAPEEELSSPVVASSEARWISHINESCDWPFALPLSKPVTDPDIDKF
jgi:hypothetical protein